MNTMQEKFAIIDRAIAMGMDEPSIETDKAIAYLRSLEFIEKWSRKEIEALKGAMFHILNINEETGEGSWDQGTSAYAMAHNRLLERVHTIIEKSFNPKSDGK